MAVRPITNPSFEDGTITGWTVPVGVNYSVTTSERTPFGQYTLRFTGSPGLFNVVSTTSYPVYPGKKITASCNYSQGPASSYKNTGRVVLEWYNSSNVKISESLGTLIFATGSSGWNQGTGMVLSSVTAEAPASSAYVKIGAQVDKNNNDWSCVDNFVWDYEALSDAKITSPTSAGIYQEGSTIYLRMSYAVPSGMEVTSSKYVVTNTITADVLEFPADLTTSPWAVNTSTIPAGSWKIIGQIVLNSGETVTTDEVNFSVGDPPPIPTREYRASNSATSLILENFSALSAAIPSTAVITGAELVVDYSLQVLSRSKDKDVDVEASNPDIAFSIIPSGKLDISLLDKNSTSYTKVGSEMSADIAIKRSDFTLDEEGISEGYKWTSFSSNLKFQAIVGSKDLLFGIGTISVQDFIAKSVGLKFTADTSSLPNTVEEGSGCVRFKLDTAKLRVYFDAGSVEYYFASPDRSSVIKGTLVAANVLNGDLRNGDGSGTLQLSEKLEIISGTSPSVGADWTVHSQYPPTDANRIATVEKDISYNALNSYAEVYSNRSRYQFITANFYGDERLNSIYGVNGVGRAFSYNGRDFYKIYTQPEAAKDKPRHLAEHHLHLALGYQEGRVDVSVVGEPYNFAGVSGASSWGVGDGVTGLLKLSGTILGIFGSNSISGLSGTTVDNFAVQTISPKMGALEYTVVDMGYPVYANSYGIYTLSQTQQYGDYLGNPLSQDISPWLRPRLVRKDISDKEVVISWPVRSKNQYRLAFADGHTLTMTMNNGQQSAPTFSLQKYFTSEGAIGTEGKYRYPCIVPAAVSSQLDQGGEERIHISRTKALDITEEVFYGPEIHGNAPNTFIGNNYSFTYSTSNGTGPLHFSVIGELPTGLYLNESTGEISGVASSADYKEFIVRVTDIKGLWAEVHDSIEVGAAIWMLRTSGAADDRLWVSGDALDWSGPYTRGPFVAAAGNACNQLSTGKVVILGGGTNGELISDLSVGDGVVTEHITVPVGVGRIRTFGKVTAAFYDDSGDGANTYWLVHGTTAEWEPIVLPAGRRIRDIARLESGRWWSYQELSFTYGMYYSDEEVPRNWTTSGYNEAATGERVIATDGKLVLMLASGGRIMRCTNGIWATLTPSGPAFYPDARAALNVEGRWIFAGQAAVAGLNLVYSDDNGASFTGVVVPGIDSVECLYEANGLLIASGRSIVADAGRATVCVSADLGATWTRSNHPYVVESGGSAVAFPVT